MVIQKLFLCKNIKPLHLNYICTECEQKKETDRKKRKMQEKNTFVDDGGVGKLSQAGAKSCCAI